MVFVAQFGKMTFAAGCDNLLNSTSQSREVFGSRLRPKGYLKPWGFAT